MASRRELRVRQAPTNQVVTEGLHLAKSVHDTGWSSFVGMLEFRARLHGRTVIKIGRFGPILQTCSADDVPEPLRPGPVPAQRGDAGTHPDSPRKAA
jgi:putative transposase